MTVSDQRSTKHIVVKKDCEGGSKIILANVGM